MVAFINMAEKNAYLTGRLAGVGAVEGAMAGHDNSVHFYS